MMYPYSMYSCTTFNQVGDLNSIDADILANVLEHTNWGDVEVHLMY